jgi:uncharacterized membrane protein
VTLIECADSPQRATSTPRLADVVARTAASIGTALVIPAVLFSAAMLLLNVYAAVVVGLAWTVGATCWRAATKRPVSGLLMLTVAIMTVRTGFTLATGNTFVYFIQPVFADALVATVFLGSLWTARPVVARLAADFYPMDDQLAARPRVRRLFQRLTAMWGLVILTKASLTLWLLETQSTVDFVLIKSTAIIALTGAGAVATICLAAAVARKEDMLARP